MKINISKLDASKRQLETAIHFLLRYGDPVSVHTLTAAARGILEDLGKQQGVASIRNDVISSVKPEYRKQVMKKANKTQNFFKHANTDPQSILEFNPELTMLEIFDACRLYTKLTSEKVPIIQLFFLFFYANHPQSLRLTENEEVIYKRAIKGLNPTDRGAFLQLLPILEKSHYGK